MIPLNDNITGDRWTPAFPTGPAGLYIHIPFCLKKCLYCDFYSQTDTSIIQGFMDALTREMEFWKNAPLEFDTIYMGGGTPSIMAPLDIERIIDTAAHWLTIRSDTEITLEVNPGTASLERLNGYRQAGVNRLNIGIQSFQDPILRFLGRIHSAGDAQKAFDDARNACFDNIGLDLIYGVPGQSLDMWRNELALAIHLKPEHLSCYCLTYEKGTPLERNLTAGEFQAVSEELAGEMFDTTWSVLSAAGFEPYEVSNFARVPHRASTAAERERYRSRHNTKYWNLTSYLGLGPSAHSFIANRRHWNHPDLKQYIRNVLSGQRPIADSETLTRDQQMIEWMYLGLRQTSGIDLRAFERRFQFSVVDRLASALAPLAAEGLIDFTGDRCHLTQTGMRFLDNITSQIVCLDLGNLPD